MVNLTIDGQKVSVPQGTTIMQAAATVGIEIPRLCYLKGINEISACKVCVVEIQGQNRVVTACTTPVQEGLVVYTNSPKARSIRRTNVELILSQHDCMCATCVRSGNCSLQTLANDLGIYDIPYERDVVDTPWNQEFPLIRDSKKCIKCMRCVQICDKVQKLHISKRPLYTPTSHLLLSMNLFQHAESATTYLLPKRKYNHRLVYFPTMHKQLVQSFPHFYTNGLHHPKK